jgi:hypothetical protein
MHARKTREKTRLFFEQRGTIIVEMTTEATLMRAHLLCMGLVSQQEVFDADLRDFKFKQEHDHLVRILSIGRPAT